MGEEKEAGGCWASWPAAACLLAWGCGCAPSGDARAAVAGLVVTVGAFSCEGKEWRRKGDRRGSPGKRGTRDVG